MDNNLFHFKFYEKKIYGKGINHQTSELNLKKRNKIKIQKFKRYIHDSIDLIKDDDRVEYVFPQISLTRNKRKLGKL